MPELGYLCLSLHLYQKLCLVMLMILLFFASSINDLTLIKGLVSEFAQVSNEYPNLDLVATHLK